MSLSAKILTGLCLGVATGLFFGEGTAFLAPIGEAFIQLLKMAVLPYIMVSLMSGLGRLSYGEGKSLFLSVGGLLVLIWMLTFAVLAVVPLTFPELETASFFSTALLHDPPPFDFLEFIPENPFGSMANNIVPAVVIFSIAVGVALMGIERKQPLIEVLDVFGDALTRVMTFVTRLTPIGVFAIAASASGTMRLDELGRLQVYVIIYIGTALMMTFWFLPILVTVLAPVRYRDVLARTKDALVMGFATDSLLIVLPMLSEQGRALVHQETGSIEEDSDAAVDVIVPASFNFPGAGKLLQLSFVLFAAWFNGSTISIMEYIEVSLAGLFSFFGKPVAAMPYLLDLVRVPADMFQLYMVSGVLAARFGTLVSVMQTFVLAVLGALAMAGMLRIRWRGALTATALTIALLVVSAAGTRAYFSYALEDSYRKDQIIQQMHLLDVHEPATVHTISPGPLGEDLSRPALERIRDRGFIRVGYLPDMLPFQFFNAEGELVGFDAAMAHDLAQEIGVRLELVALKRSTLAKALNEGECDIIMSGLPATPERGEEMQFSVPYLDMTLAFVVKDHLREDFDDLESLRSLDGPRIAVISSAPHFVAVARKLAPNAELIPIENPAEFFEDSEGRFDALEFSAEMGAAYTLMRPEFAVAVPLPAVVKMPTVYLMAWGDPAFKGFVDAWLELRKDDGTVTRHYDHWILGENAATKMPRWSVVRDVLHWVE